MSDLVETWRIHNRIHGYVLDTLTPEALASGVQRVWPVGKQFAHIHQVRLMWLKSAAPDLLDGLEKVEAVTDAAALRSALDDSGEAIATLIERSLATTGKVKGFKPHVTAFVGYLISHESYHRAEIGITLQQTGHPLSHKIAFGQWEWGVR